MKEEKIKVLALLPMELPKEIDLDNTLEAIPTGTTLLWMARTPPITNRALPFLIL